MMMVIVTTMMVMVVMTMITMVMVVMTMIMTMMMMDSYVDKQQMRLYHDSIIVSCVSYSEREHLLSPVDLLPRWSILSCRR
jgi:hypothetical protein